MNAPAGLTRSQFKVLRFIEGYILEHGNSPSIADIAAGTGRRYKGSTYDHVQQLVRRGFITVVPGRARSIALVGANVFTIPLPAGLADVARTIAHCTGVTPEAVIVEAVRDRLTSLRSASVARETKLPRATVPAVASDPGRRDTSSPGRPA